MAELATNGSNPRKRSPGVRKAKKLSTRIDLTPMVDLGFLLITFFMYTTTLARPQTMEIQMPYEQKDAKPTEIKRSVALTVLISKNHLLYIYEGMGNESAPLPILQPVSIVKNTVPLRRLILSKKAAIDDLKMKGALSPSDGIFILIKPDSNSTYKDLADVFDEMSICNVKDYAKVDFTDDDQELIRLAVKQTPSN